MSEKSNYYFYFLGYGMNTNNDFNIVATGNVSRGTIGILSYLQGEGPTTYQAADSLLAFTLCEDASQGLTLPLQGNKSMKVYRSLAVYSPTSEPSGVEPATRAWRRDDDACYTLQGTRTTKPGKGIYIYINSGRKVVVK